jgi:hypothetical protein
MSGLVRGNLDVKARSWHVIPDHCPAAESWGNQQAAPIPVECMYGASDGQTYTCPMLEWISTDDLGRRRLLNLGGAILYHRMNEKGSETFYMMCKVARHGQWRFGAGPLP